MSPENNKTSFRALQFSSSTAPPEIVHLPVPPIGAGTALVKPLFAPIVSYSNDILMKGNPRGYYLSWPIVPGTSAVAELVASPPDAPTLQSTPAGALCWIDPYIRARDDHGVTTILQGLSAGHSSKSRILMEGEWRNGTYAEIAKVPAECIHLLNRDRLLKKPEEGGLGYELVDFCYIGSFLVPYGGLADVGVKPGEIVVVAPATGHFGSAAVRVALSMGADVIALGRNEQRLQELEALHPSRVKTVRISGDVQADKNGILAAAQREPDVFFDISPPTASKSSHIMAGMLSVRKGGRVSFMGGCREDISFPYRVFSHKNLTLRGTHMYTTQQVIELIRMIEAGRLELGRKAGVHCAGVFELEQWEQAFETASKDGARPGRFAAFRPTAENRSSG